MSGRVGHSTAMGTGNQARNTRLALSRSTTRRRWHNRRMERDGQLELYGVLAARLKLAHARVANPEVPDGTRRELTRRLLAVTAVAKHDLTDAARRLDVLTAELDDLGIPDH